MASFADKFVNIPSSSREEFFNLYDYESISNAILENSKEELGFQIFSSALQNISDEQLIFEIIQWVSLFTKSN